MKVKELIKELQQLEKTGHGDYIVGITDPENYNYFYTIDHYTVVEPEDDGELGSIVFEIY